MVGSAAAQTLDASGYSGSAILVSGGGTDTLKGGTGANTYQVDVSNLASSEQVSVTTAGTSNSLTLTGFGSTSSTATLDYINWTNAPGAITLPSKAPSSDTMSKLVAVPKSTTMAAPL